jgi:5-methylcytosine-specific restriction protein A
MANRKLGQEEKSVHPFSLGQEYRRAALLEFLGSGQEMPGVLWGPREPGCVICTSGGRHGKKAGYSDGHQPDGSWLYVGQGRTGDQRLENSANAKLSAGDRSVLLFTTREPNAKERALHGHAKFYVFRGAFNVSGFEFFSPNEGSRKGDRLIRFFLFPADDAYAESLEPGLEEVSGAQPSLGSLQARLLEAASTAKPARISTVQYRARSAAVHRYARARAGGICECCDLAAPFENDAGIPYLEVHHLHRLADDGPDVPGNVAAVCPNCHRALHLSTKRVMHASALQAKIREREEAVRLAGA